MLCRKIKIFLYISLLVFILNLIIPIYTCAVDKDSIYVWSDNSSSLSTSNSVSTESTDDKTTNQENSR